MSPRVRQAVSPDLPAVSSQPRTEPLNVSWFRGPVTGSFLDGGLGRDYSGLWEKKGLSRVLSSPSGPGTRGGPKKSGIREAKELKDEGLSLRCPCPV